MIKVLLVEDDSIEFKLFKRNLGKISSDIEVDWASSPITALDYLAERNYDCLVSDYWMPELSGLMFLSKIRESKNNLPFIFFTGQGDEEIAAEALRLGADDYFRKDSSFALYSRLYNSIKNKVALYRSHKAEELAMQKLKLSEERFRKIFEQSPIAIEIYDAEGKLISANSTCLEVFGISNISHIKTFNLFEDPNISEEMKQYLKNGLICTNELKFDFDLVKKHNLYPTSKKGFIYLHVVISPLFEEEQTRTIVGYLVQLSDITQRKMAEKEIIELKDRLLDENAYLQEEIKEITNYGEIVGSSKELKAALSRLEKVGKTEATVLIRGESGTGKELFARAIHNLSDRNSRPMVKVDCSALPENLIESELFGHEKGSYTGALEKKIGLFEIADKSTIFLDEIGELPIQLQSKLLRILQDGEFLRIGNTSPISIDVRIIAATNRNLEAMIEEGKFREDLYYRLNVFPVFSPPLRHRKSDIQILARHFVQKHSSRLNKKNLSINKNQIKELESYSWPGNVRELENIIERSLIISSDNQFILDNSFKGSLKEKNDEEMNLDNIVKNHLIAVLEQTNWKVSGEDGAAKLLGINPQTLFSKMRKLGIKRP